MKCMDDRRTCPHCQKPMNATPYLMSRRSSENVLSWTQIAWMVVAAMLIILSSALPT